MQSWSKLRSRIRALFLRRRLEEEMRAEIQEHIDRRTAALIAAGEDPAEARYAALRQFGGVEQIKEAARDARGVTWAEQFIQDIVYGARLLRRAPGFATVAILTLALGIGATTAIFSVVRGVLLRPLNYPNPTQLVALREQRLPVYPQAGVTPARYFSWHGRADLFENIAAWDYSFYTVNLGDAPQRRFALRVSPNFLATYGVGPSLGRDFQPGEDTPERGAVVILGYGLWVSEFAGSPDAIGKTLRLDNQSYTIIGVAPEWFPPANYTIDLFIPKVFGPGERADGAGHYLDVVGRLKPGVSLERARAALRAMPSPGGDLLPESERGWSVVVTPLLEDTVSGWRSELLTLLAAVGCLLLIACTNVANLLLARASAREREIAVRVALGAGRSRILRQLLAEGVLLAMLGGAAGVGVAWLAMQVLLTIAPDWLPRVGEISLDGGVLVFTWVLCVVAGVGFALAPALHASQVAISPQLKNTTPRGTATRKRQRIRRGLIVAEVALATALLFAAGLVIRSLRELEQIDPGFESEDVYYMAFNLSSERFPDDPGRAAFVQQFLHTLAGMPGIDHAAVISRYEGVDATTEAAARAGAAPTHALACAITSDYFQTLGIELLRGRSFTPTDTAGHSPVVIIDTEMAHRLFPQRPAIGERVELDPGSGDWREIVGIVNHVKPSLGEKSPVPQVYLPFAQHPEPAVSLYVHSSRTRLNLVATIRSSVTAVEKGMAVGYLHYLPHTLHASLKVHSYFAFIFGVFSASALLLSATGIYGVMSSTVTQRTAEIGIRSAFGATRVDIIRLVFADAARLVGLGLLLGTAGALVLSRLISFMLFNVQPYDPFAFAGVVILLTATAGLACWVPIRRATRLEPMVALRAE